METENHSQMESLPELLDLSREYNQEVDGTTSNLKDADKDLTELLKKAKDMFNEVMESKRTKYVYGPQVMTSIADLLKQKSSIRKDLANIAERKLQNNLKIRELLKEEGYGKNKENESINPANLLRKMEELINTKK